MKEKHVQLTTNSCTDTKKMREQKKKTGNKQKLFEKYIHIKLVIFYY